MPVCGEKWAVGVFGLWADGEGFPGSRVCLGVSWKRQGRVEGSLGFVDDDDEEEEDFQGSGRYAPRVIRFSSFSSSCCPDGSVWVPWSMRSVADCQVSTWWEKEVSDDPCWAVEKTGYRRAPLRKRFGIEGEQERKKDRCDRVLWFRIDDSKLPGDMIEPGTVQTSGGCFSIGPGEEAVPLRLWERSRFLLNRRCSNKDVKGSKR